MTISHPPILKGNLDAAREQITARRGLTGRWYKAEQVDELLDGVARRLAAVMGELERVRRAYARLADVDHARRHGSLPSGMPIETVDPDEVEWRIREQEAIDRMLDDAARQAAAIINDARHQYLVTAERGDDGGLANNGLANDGQARADRAEARLRDVGTFLEEWTRYLLERDAVERRAATQRADDLANARRAASALLAEFIRIPGQHRDAM